MDRLIKLEPSNLVMVRIEPGQRCYGKLTLRNVMYTIPVAFRLQPVDKTRYTIRPQSGIIPHLATLTVEITYHLPPTSTLPDSFPHSDDSFLLHSVVVPGLSSFDSVPDEWFTTKKKQVFIDSGIKIMFVGSPILARLVSDGSMDELREVLEMSVSAWQAVDSLDLQGQTLLHLAIARGRPDLVQLLLEFEPDVEARSRAGRSPLEAAAAAGEPFIVELLLARRASTERSGPSAWGPLHFSAGAGHLEVMRLLLINRADVDAVTNDGRTALHLAVEERRRDCARLLLAYGARVDMPSADTCDTPLHVAASVGDEHLVKLLLQKGANKEIRNRLGKTAYDIAAESGHTRLFDALRLGDRLCSAARKGDLRAVHQLFDKGAVISGRDQYGWTALHRASFKGHLDMARNLVERGVDIDAKDDDGYTALHCATESGNADVIELLMKKGADVTTRTNKGVTSLQIANSLHYSGIVRILVQGGATREGASPLAVPAPPPLRGTRAEEHDHWSIKKKKANRASARRRGVALISH